MKKLPLCVLLWDVWHCKVSNQQMKLSSWLSTFCKDGHKRTNKPSYHHRRNARALDNLQQFDARYSGQCSLNTSEQCLLWKLTHDRDETSTTRPRFRGMLLLCRIVFGWMLPMLIKLSHAFHMSHWAFLPSTAWALPVSEQPSQPQFVSGFGGSGTTYKRLQNAWTCFVQLILTTQSLSIVHVDPWFSMRSIVPWQCHCKTKWAPLGLVFLSDTLIPPPKPLGNNEERWRTTWVP